MNPNILVRRSLRLRYHILSFCDRKLALAQVFSLCILSLLKCRKYRILMTYIATFLYSTHCWRNFANPVVEVSKLRCLTQSLAQVCNLCLQNRWSKFATSILYPFSVSNPTLHSDGCLKGIPWIQTELLNQKTITHNANKTCHASY
jgi:hypothetical protein